MPQQKKKRNHFVPQSYLRSFAADERRKRIWTFGKNGGDFEFRDSVSRDPRTGALRPMRIEDLHGLVQAIELVDAVPPPKKEQFDIARNAFVYSSPNTTKSPGLGKLLKQATAKGFLNRADFAMPSDDRRPDWMIFRR